MAVNVRTLPHQYSCLYIIHIYLKEHVDDIVLFRLYKVKTRVINCDYVSGGLCNSFKNTIPRAASSLIQYSRHYIVPSYLPMQLHVQYTHIAPYDWIATGQQDVGWASNASDLPSIFTWPTFTRYSWMNH